MHKSMSKLIWEKIENFKRWTFDVGNQIGVFIFFYFLWAEATTETAIPAPNRSHLKKHTQRKKTKNKLRGQVNSSVPRQHLLNRPQQFAPQVTYSNYPNHPYSIQIQNLSHVLACARIKSASAVRRLRVRARNILKNYLNKSKTHTYLHA